MIICQCQIQNTFAAVGNRNTDSEIAEVDLLYASNRCAGNACCCKTVFIYINYITFETNTKSQTWLAGSFITWGMAADKTKTRVFGLPWNSE